MALLLKGFKFFSWFLLSMLVLVAAFYSLLIAINWSDEAPSALTITLNQEVEANLAKQHTINTTENGYYFYLNDVTKSQYPLSPLLANIVQACRAGDCSVLLSEHVAQLPTLLAEHQALLDFYQSLRTFSDWHETIPSDAFDLPPYQPLFHAQSVFLLQAWLAVQQNDMALARQILDEDLKFWRKLLQNNRLLISKMVSGAAVTQHFNFAKLIKQSMSEEQQLGVTPESWQQPFSQDELTMYPVFAGEWHYANHMLNKLWQHDLAGQAKPWYEQTILTVSQPFFKQQATKNALAVMYMACSDGLQPPFSPWYSWLYNPVGKLLNRAGSSSFCGNYTDRIQQLEVQRQQLLE